MGIHSRARPTITSLLLSSGNGYENQSNISWCQNVDKMLSKLSDFETNLTKITEVRSEWLITRIIL